MAMLASWLAGWLTVHMCGNCSTNGGELLKTNRVKKMMKEIERRVIESTSADGDAVHMATAKGANLCGVRNLCLWTENEPFYAFLSFSPLLFLWVFFSFCSIHGPFLSARLSVQSGVNEVRGKRAGALYWQEKRRVLYGIPHSRKWAAFTFFDSCHL